MKTMNYIKIGIASSILSIAAGCTSFLEEDLKSSLAPDNTYTSSLGFEVGATGLYAIARSEYNTWGENGAFMHNGACAYEVLQISTDLCRMGTVRDGSLVPFAEMTLNPSTLFVGSYWNWAYNLIASANELLIYSEKNDNWDYPTDKQLYQAEARFFRAYAYRTLVYLYGDVPWVETIQKPFLLSFSRDPKIEVQGNIIKDLEFAKTYLPDNPDNVKEGKLTTWAARHLLSEMYLLRGAEGDYKLAEENAQDVIDCPYYSLMKSRFGNAKNDPGDYFSDMFVENNQNRSAGNTEGIWVMQFQYNTVGGGTNSDDWTRLESPVPRHRRIRTGRLARRPRPGADLSAEVVDRRQGNQRHDGRRKGGVPRYSGKRHLRRRRHPQLGVQHQAQLVLQQPADAQQAGTKMPHRRQIVVAGPALPGAEEIFLR